MRSVTVASAAMLAVGVNADLCSLASNLIGGNWYCSAVDTIQYHNWAQSGSYQRITSMDSNTGACGSTPFGYAGSMAPLNDEVSLHFRGPLALKQLAWYTPGSGNSKKERRHHNHKRHGHAQFHAKDAEVQAQAEEKKRDVGDWVFVTMNGQLVSWINEWSGVPTQAAAPQPAPVDNNVGAVVTPPPSNPTPQSSDSSKDTSSDDDTKSYDGDWVQQAYYDAASQTNDGFSFLNHNGGSGSGVFDYTFGNSLSYASADGTAGAANPQILADTTLPSNEEIAIFTDKSCDDGGCGFSRPGSVAMHGFGGDKKIFLAELSMPLDGNRGFNGDMPAYWMLNAEIPRTLQYGKADCSCWNNNGQCGEFDILEVLDSGNTRCKSTLHAGISGGDSDYIERPTGAPIKVAVVMSDTKATIKVLDSSFDFSKTLSNAQVAAITADDTSSNKFSLFNLGRK